MGHDTSLNPSSAITATNTANPTSTIHARPSMTSLSATAARGINRAPLTPKIATVARPSPRPRTPAPATATIAATTPIPRRTSQRRPVSTIAATIPSDDSDALSAVALNSPYLTAHITPRSGARQNRAGSTSSTPNGTPNQERPERPDRTDSWESRSSFPFTSSVDQGASARKPVVTFSAVSPEKDIRNPKFFHASDLKPSRPASAPRVASRESAFFHANDNMPKSPSTAALSPPLSPGLGQSQDNLLSKFMYANGTPELEPTPPPLTSRGSGASIVNASKGPSARSASALQRPASPNRLPQRTPSSSSSSSHRNSAGASSHRNSTGTQSVPPPLGPSPHGLRRPGTTTPRSGGHSRTGSLAKIEGVSEVTKPLASPTTGLFPAANVSPAIPPPLTLASIIQAAEDFAEQESDKSDVSFNDPSAVQSPTKSAVSSADPVTGLVSNARMERKVQDLQIRNTSLEAINRTIERQLRKQTAELRRFRRLSRAGHLTVPSTATDDDEPSGATLESELTSSGLSDLGEEDVLAEAAQDEPASDTDSASSGLSPSDLAERDAKHRPRDEERLNVDLSKHQQILDDSQKINKSIKRCLDWTEELIKDAKKALEYKIKPSDVKIGGRVLDPLDMEEHNSGLRPSTNRVIFNIGSTREDSDEEPEENASWDADPQDRDSGIELPKDEIEK